ncbi:MAG: DUF364 domain-containing protein [Candidatus Muiribacteriota bacterium]
MDKITRDLIKNIPDKKVKLKYLAMYLNNIVAVSYRTATAGICHNMPENRMQTKKYIDFSSYIGKPCDLLINELSDSDNMLHRAVLYAVINSLTPLPEKAEEKNAFDFLSEEYLESRKSVFIGHFPRGEKYREKGFKADIIEMNPSEGDFKWGEADHILAEANVVFITGITLLNQTFSEIINKTIKAEKRILTGPTAPLSEKMFDYGIDIIGSIEILNFDKMETYWRMGGSGMKHAPENSIRILSLAK